MSELPQSKKDARAFARFFNSAASEVEFDKQGRINITPTLREHAGLVKNCRVIGVNDRIEIWDEERWKAYIAETEENFEELAEHMIDFGF